MRKYYNRRNLYILLCIILIVFIGLGVLFIKRANRSTTPDGSETEKAALIPEPNENQIQQSAIGKLCKEFKDKGFITAENVLKDPTNLYGKAFYEDLVRGWKGSTRISNGYHGKRYNKYVGEFLNKEGIDSLYQMFKLLKHGKKIGITVCGNPQYVGQGFAAKPDGYNSPKLQEQSLMFLLQGLAPSAMTYAEIDKNNNFITHGNKLIYKDGVFNGHFLYCPDLKYRFTYDPTTVFDENGEIFFSEFLYDQIRAKKLFFLPQDDERSPCEIDAYILISPTRSSFGFFVDHEKLYNLIYDQIGSTLVHGREKNIKYMVIAIPGFGVFAEGCKKFKATVLLAAENAVRNFGGGYDGIIVCGKEKSKKGRL